MKKLEKLLNQKGFAKIKLKLTKTNHFELRASINGVKGQYIRFYSQGNSADKSNHYIEIQVYGK